MEKLTKTARVLHKIVRILYRLGIVGTIVTAVALVLITLLPADSLRQAVSSADMTIELGTAELHLSRILEPIGDIRLFLCAVFGVATASLALSVCALKLVLRILRLMADGRPFDGTVSANFKRLGWVTLAGVAVHYVMDGVDAAMDVSMFDLDQIFRPDMVKGVTIQNTDSLSCLLIPIMMFLLSYVFRYGGELQRQSDETL